jgi:hypothetical protein
MKENTIITLVMNNGAEIIGKYISDDFNSITIYKPKMVQASQQSWYRSDP